MRGEQAERGRDEGGAEELILAADLLAVGFVEHLPAGQGLRQRAGAGLAAAESASQAPAPASLSTATGPPRHGARALGLRDAVSPRRCDARAACCATTRARRRRRTLRRSGKGADGRRLSPRSGGAPQPIHARRAPEQPRIGPLSAAPAGCEKQPPRSRPPPAGPRSSRL